MELKITILMIIHLFVKSGFQELNIKCSFEKNETVCMFSDHCMERIDLTTCQTLQMHCIENNVAKAVSFCNSSKECGFHGIPDNLIGSLDCEITKDNQYKDEIKCSVNVICEHEKYVCATPETCQWSSNQYFKEISNARCVLMHDVRKCIKLHSKWVLPEHMNCTITTEDNIQLNNSKKNTPLTLCDKTEVFSSGYITSIVFAATLGLVSVILIVNIIVVECRKQRNQRRTNEENSLQDRHS